MAISRQHKELATRIAGEYARMVVASLPRIGQAMIGSGGQASFSVTAQFRTLKDETMVCELKPRERIPLEKIQIKIAMEDGQLSLFEGPPAEPEDEGQTQAWELL